MVCCGKCVECQRRRLNDWFLRLSNEMKHSTFSVFVTLTYDEQNLPFDPDTGEVCVSKRDVQLFHKRLRKELSTNVRPTVKFRYFVVSEFGGETNRPHYHGLYFFDCSIDNKPIKSVSQFHFHSLSDLFHREWGKGFIQFAPLNEKRIRYTLKYILKDEANIGRFSLMSRNPGLGKCYIDDQGQWHRDSLDRTYVILPGGIKFGLPRYYRDKIYTEPQKRVIYKRYQKRLQEEKQRLGEAKIREANIANFHFRQLFKDKPLKKK